MEPEEMRRRVESARVARLATVAPGGRPRVVPCTFAVDGDRWYSAVDHKPKVHRRLARLDDLRRDPRATVLVDHYDDDWSALWWVRLEGEARVVESGDEFEAALDRLEARYAQYRARRPEGPVIALDVERWHSWSATT